MKRGFFSAGLLFLVLVGLLGALAVGYGLWSKVLTIEGSVTTGDFNADWDTASTNDSGTTLDPCTPGLNPNDCATFPPKNVGRCEVTGAGSQNLVVTITNAYPSYECTVTAAVTNTGTIPFNVLVGTSSSDDELDVVCTGTPGQVDPGQELEGTCWLHVTQDAKERSTYTAQASLCVAQWNESPTLADCVAAAGQSEP